MKCPVCKNIIPDNSLRCPHCKTRTGLICKHCHTVNTIFDVACKKCGERSEYIQQLNCGPVLQLRCNCCGQCLYSSYWSELKEWNQTNDCPQFTEVCSDSAFHIHTYRCKHAGDEDDESAADHDRIATRKELVCRRIVHFRQHDRQEARLQERFRHAALYRHKLVRRQIVRNGYNRSPQSRAGVVSCRTSCQRNSRRRRQRGKYHH